MTNTTNPAIEIKQIPAETISVPIRGTAPLIVHRFSEKARKQMLDQMQGRKTPKEPKDPEAEYLASLYHLKDGRPGFPSSGFRQATVAAARFYGRPVTMTLLRQAMFFRGEPGDDGQLMTAIVGDHEMREDYVRVGMGGASLSYRAMFAEWNAILVVSYVTSLLTRDSVVSLIDAGGLGVGIGDWRPERNGTFGSYEVDQTRNIEVLS